MSKNKTIIFLATLVALLPTSFIGLPPNQEEVMQILLGLAIIFISVWSIVDKRLSLKAKAQKRQAHKRQMESLNSFGEDINEEASGVPEGEEAENISLEYDNRE